jgi:hypothetical protein
VLELPRHQGGNHLVKIKLYSEEFVYELKN